MSMRQVYLILFLFFVCTTSRAQVTIAVQDFETSPATPTLGVLNVNGSFSTGTNGASGLPANANLFVSGARGRQAITESAQMVFNDQSLSGYTNAFIDFRLAGM